MHVPGGGAVGDQGHRQRSGVGRVVEDFYVQHRGQPAQPLGADAQRVDLLVQLQPQRLEAREGRAGALARHQLVHVHRGHERLLGQQHGFFGRAAYAQPQNARRTPARAHAGHRFEHPVHDRVRGVEHGEPGLVLGAAALGGTGHFHLVPGHDLAVHHRRRVVARVFARPGRVGQHRGAQRVVRV